MADPSAVTADGAAGVTTCTAGRSAIETHCHAEIR